ncbi:MAG: CopD family protein [Anaerolineales bacterium]|nr:CopD family protein [Anaerolineales bacterium]
MPQPAAWILALIYWLHMLATVIWIGSLTAIFLLVLPAAKRTLSLADQLSFISAVQKRLEPIAWFSIVLLTASGLIQMSVNPHYDGFINISTQWSIAMLVKHLLGVAMIIVMAVQTWETLPAIHRILLIKHKANTAELEKLNRKENLLLQINIWIAILVLLATGFARAS